MNKPCIIAAALFACSSFLNALKLVFYAASENHDFAELANLDTDYLVSRWEYRGNHRGLQRTAGWMNALAWFILCIPLVQLVWVQSVKSGFKMASVHTSIVILGVGGAIMELTAHLMYIGTTQAMDWIADDFNLDLWVDNSTTADGVGWKTLEVIHMAAMGLTVWVDAIEWLFLALIFVLIFLSVRSSGDDNGSFSLRWAFFGLVISVVCMVIFVSNILGSDSFMSVTVQGFSYTINHTILFPAWLLWLGRDLPHIIEEQEVAVKRNQNDSVSIMESIGEGPRIS